MIELRNGIEWQPVDPFHMGEDERLGYDIGEYPRPGWSLRAGHDHERNAWELGRSLCFS